MSEAIIIQNKTTASFARKSIENRAQLPNKGDIYIGTGEKIESGSTIPDTKGQNIIDAINNNQTDDKYVQLKDKNNLLNLIYPVGSIYITTSGISPQVFLGGTWEVFGKGRTLVGVDVSDTTGAYTKSEQVGGEEKHTLTTNEMPSHSHYYTKLYNSGFVGNIGSSGDVLTSTNAATETEGGSQPHNNMPPYITVYMFKRTA